MLSRIDPRCYVSEEVFDRERDVLFERVWQFFTLKNLLARHNAFVTRRLFGRSIVVQSFHGELRAFDNVCLHRQAALQWDSEGVRPLVCRYHAWGYDADGHVETIPFEEVYRFGKTERAALCLRRYPLHVIGNLVFISLSPDPIAIEEQFSPELIESLRASSESYDGEVAVTTFHGKFNWKLAYENLRDGNHPRFVHARTLAKTFTFLPSVEEAQLAEVKALRAAGPLDRAAAMALLRRFSYGGKEAELDNLQPLEWHRHIEPWQPEVGYYNWLAFPNLHIAAPTGGHAFTLEHHVPVSANETDLVLYWVTGRRTGPYEQAPAVLYANMLGAQRVLAEDIEVMERVHGSLRPGGPRANVGDYESTNLLVDTWYADLIEGSFAL